MVMCVSAVEIYLGVFPWRPVFPLCVKGSRGSVRLKVTSDLW
uniref:Uncharacterized protein n=1 Tax=Anguilla anguilla TaxID=7936 RepID=A0A0E9UES5_ANGAN